MLRVPKSREAQPTEVDKSREALLVVGEIQEIAVVDRAQKVEELSHKDFDEQGLAAP